MSHFPDSVPHANGSSALGRSFDENLVFRWILASVCSGGLGIWLMQRSYRQTEVGGSVSFVLNILGIGVLPPFVTGVLQWLVLRRTLPRANWWIPASTVGFGMGFLIFGAVLNAGMFLLQSEESPWWILPFTLGSLLFGAAAGVAQSLVVRRSLAWTAGWALASAVGFSPAVLHYILVTRGNDAGQMPSVAVGAVSGLIYGAMTALPLCWMLRELDASR